MAESNRETDRTKNPGRNLREADEEIPIRHPSQAEGERGSEDGGPEEGEEVDERPRPSQAEGDRDE